MSGSAHHEQLEAAAARLRAAGRVTVMTGAGVSAASGIPTFRGQDGLWRRFRAEELATAEAFSRDPATVWEWYAWRRALIAEARPNAAHLVLASWERRLPGFTLVTQNVDGLHERAGSAEVVRLHGSIWDLACWAQCRSSPRRWHDDRVPLPELPPRCPHCGALARPGVVWFGEMLDPADLDAANAAVRCDVFLTVGTSSLVYPAAGFVHAARARGAFTIEVNPEATEASDSVSCVLRLPAEVALPALDERLATG